MRCNVLIYHRHDFQNSFVMIRKYLLTSFFLVAIILNSFGQLQDASAYQRALTRLKVIKNDNYLPLSSLDQRKIAFVQLPGNSFETALTYLNKYVPIPKKNILANLDSYDDLILVIPTGLGAPEKEKLSGLLAAKPTTLILLGDSDEDWPAAKAVIRSDTSQAGQAIAAQYVFGGIGEKKDINGIRLGYVPPAVVGMDGAILQDSIRAIVAEGLLEKAYPGAQVLVAHQGKVVYHEAFGYHTYDSLQATQLTDIYDLASVSKVSSGLAALMKWYGEGSFDLDAPLKQYYPDFAKSNKSDIPIRQILAHNARLRPWIPYWQGTLKGNAKYPWRNRWKAGRTNDYRFKRKTLSRDSSEEFSIYLSEGLYQHRDFRQKMMKSIRKTPLNEEPGYVYSGLFFYLLPKIVADQSGMEMEAYLKKTFYHPLGAYTLTYNPLRYFPKEQIIPTEVDTFFRMTQLHGVVHDEGAAMMEGVSCNAGLFSSANDLAKLFQMYMNGGSYGGEQLIAEDAVREFARCQYCKEDNRRGLGFDKPLIEFDPEASTVAEATSPNSFGHSGYTGTFVWVDPDAELLFIFLSNRVHPTRNNRKLYQLGIRPRIHAAIYEALGNK